MTKSFYPKRLNSKWKIIWILVQVVIITIGYYLFVYESFRYKSWNNILGGTMVVVGFLFIIMAFIDSPHGKKRLDRLKFYIPFILFGLGSIYLLTSQRTNFYKQQALVPTLAEIIGKEREKTLLSRSRSRTYAIIRYSNNGQEIIQQIDDYGDRYVIGHYVPIKYSEKEPELFIINYDYKE